MSTTGGPPTGVTPEEQEMNDSSRDGEGWTRTQRPPDLIGLLAVVGAGLLPVMVVNAFYYSVWAPKAAMCLVLLGPGLVMLARMVVSRSRAAILAVAFLSSAALSTALSDKPVLSLFGAANWGTGLAFLGTLAGAWALGSCASDRRRRQMAMVIIAAVVLNAVVAWGQVRVGDGVGERTRGLMGNAVFLGGLVAGGLFLLGRRFGQERRTWWWLPAIMVVAGAVQLSGGRAAVALAVAAVLASLRGAGWVRGAALLAAVAVGVVLAPLGATGTTLGSERTRQIAVAAGNDTRFAVWRISAGAMAESPLVGFGPGRFPAATGPRYNAVAAQEGVVLKDAHNWLVENALTTGLLGIVLLLAWLGSASWRARGPLAGFALIVAASTLIQPMNAGLTPMALLALGAAGPGRAGEVGGASDGTRLGRKWGLAALAGLAVGLVAAGVLLVGQVSLQRGVEDDSFSRVQQADALSPPWPEVMLVAASVEATYGLEVGEPHKSRALELTRRAVARDPADPSLWVELGYLELAWGTNEGALDAFEGALAVNPWDANGLQGRVAVAERQGDRMSLEDSCRRLELLGRAETACSTLMP